MENTNPPGGSRKGAGRKSGPEWNGSGEYKKMVKKWMLYRPDQFAWLEKLSNELGLSIPELVRGFIDKQMEKDGV